ncbi:MAG: PQQ-binding-like beta-propeller repeat protein [Fimbriimonadaceae bacterium]|nr:PQQ-binding-like beta-propeller repeat protein [Fimbriimonadaceae bacterium]
MGTCPPPQVAWRLGGVAPGATVLATGEASQAVLVGGPRSGEAAPLLGDLAVLSPRGWAERRVTAPGGLVGLPALLRKVALAANPAGVLHLWPLGLGDRETDPWTVDSTGPAAVGPLVVGRNYLFAAAGRLAAVSDLIEPRWSVEVGEVTAPLASDGSSVYLAGATTLQAVDARSGDRLWRIALPAAPQTGLLATAGLVLGGLADGTLRAWDAADGSAVWQTATVTAPFAPHLALAGPWVVAAAGERLLAADTAAGSPVWQASAPPPVGSPTIGYGRAFVVAGDGQLHAVAFSTDQPPWQFTARTADGQAEPLRGVVSLLAQRAYVTTGSGTLLALDLPGASGPLPWPVPGGGPSRNGRVLPPDEEAP